MMNERRYVITVSVPRGEVTDSQMGIQRAHEAA
jgi:hypothetical protein